MKVMAVPGVQVPKEDQPRAFITADETVEVPSSAYYLRILADGDLVEVARDKPAATSKGGE